MNFILLEKWIQCGLLLAQVYLNFDNLQLWSLQCSKYLFYWKSKRSLWNHTTEILIANSKIVKKKKIAFAENHKFPFQKSDSFRMKALWKKNYHHNFRSDLLIWCLSDFLFFFSFCYWTGTPICNFFHLYAIKIASSSVYDIKIMLKLFIAIFRVVSFDINIKRSSRPFEN